MAQKIPWDKFETALLLDSCMKVSDGSIKRKDAVSSLSALLRKRASGSGIPIDDKFRNENGISLQMSHMVNILTDGAEGLPGGGKIYKEMAQLFRSSPSEFEKILKEARKQVGEFNAKILQ